ncbi:MAG: hypothetical protein AABY95_08070 [Pseudomonadota bacterium]
MNKYVLIVLAITLIGCTAKTSFTSTQPGTKIYVRERPMNPPASGEFRTTSFGAYDFKVVDPAGQTFYGSLPLKFNPGYMVADILLFAPGLFFNLREVYPQYEIDPDRYVVRYRASAKAPWLEYKATLQEENGAKRFFERQRTPGSR